MSKINPTGHTRLEPLAESQVWRMAEMNFQAGMLGKHLEHYKLGRHDAVRVPQLL